MYVMRNAVAAAREQPSTYYMWYLSIRTPTTSTESKCQETHHATHLCCPPRVVYIR